MDLKAIAVEKVNRIPEGKNLLYCMGSTGEHQEGVRRT